MCEEEISHAYGVYHHTTPRMFYIDEEGTAHAFTNGFAEFELTKKWIEDRLYKKSPQIFKAPAKLSWIKLRWAYIVKEVR